MQLYLAVTPAEAQAAGRYTRSLAHVAYRIGPSSSLLRQNLLMNTRGGLLSLSDRESPAITAPEKLAAAVLRECGLRGYSGAVLDFEESPTPERRAFVKRLSEQMGRQLGLLVPEAYASDGGTVLVNTAVSGGSLLEHLQSSMGRYGRSALDLQRLSMDFILPALSGRGRPMPLEELQSLLKAEAPAVFFSQDLCARYFTYTRDGKTHFIIYDDAETLNRKLRIGSSLGYQTALVMYPEVSDLLEKLFGRESR